MPARIRDITFDCSDPQPLASLYAELLVMSHRLLDTDDRIMIGRDDERPRLAFTAAPNHRVSTWPDPTYPQQLHLDIPVNDHNATAALVLSRGATPLPWGSAQEEAQGLSAPGEDAFQVYADPAGHPFCLCTNPEVAQGKTLPGRVGNIVFDCFDSPRRLASFYAELLDMPTRPMDYEGWVLITREDSELPRLGFQGADGKPPAWPDPNRPQQIHLDIEVDDLKAADSMVTKLGATRLSNIAANHSVYADPEGHPFCLAAS